MKANRPIPTYTWYSWGLALVSVLVLAGDLFFRLPSPTVPFESSKPSKMETTAAIKEDSIQDCCLATIISSETARQAVVLGHSLSHTGSVPPKMYAFTTDKIDEKYLKVIKKYFQVIEAPKENEIGKFTEFLYWTKLKSCAPVVAVSPIGVFNKPADRLCRAKPFASVSKVGDVVYFDSSLMVIDPKDVPKDNSETTWQKYINREMVEWNPLPSDLSVDDFNNEYIDFWLKYQSPTYIHFTNETFTSAVAKANRSMGSEGLFKIIKRIVSNAKKDHPEVFN